MADSIQKTSTIPLPNYQTVSGQHDPLPLNSKEQTEKTEAKQSQNTSDTNTQAFLDYLNQQAISTLEKIQQSTVFNAAEDVEKSSTYQGMGSSGPV